MRRWLVVCAMLGVALACSRQRGAEPPSRPAGPVGFVDRVWTVDTSPGGPGDLYIFLSDGTFIRAAKEAVPDVGKWSWDGKQLTVIWAALPYTADIDSLTDSYFKLTFHLVNRSFDVGLALAVPSMPDTTHTVEFDPAQASINAMGKEPAWLFAVDNDRAMLRTAKDGTLYYEGGEWVQGCAAVWDYSAHRKFAGGEETIEMQLSTGTCVDSTSGGESPLTAILIRGEKSWYGCAVAGKLQTSQSPDPKK